MIIVRGKWYILISFDLFFKSLLHFYSWDLLLCEVVSLCQLWCYVLINKHKPNLPFLLDLFANTINET